MSGRAPRERRLLLNVFEPEKWVEYEDTQILRKVGQVSSWASHTSQSPKQVSWVNSGIA
jgi:hypothetical protein